MGDELKFPGRNSADRDALDESVIELIREAYLPPGGDAYWSGLETRIISRIQAEGSTDISWWNELAPWAKPALIAAAAIFALAGVVNQQMGDADSQFAYDSVLQSSTPEVVATSAELLSVERGVDGAALSYFLSH